MSDTLEHETPEQRRLRLRVEQSRHAEAERLKQRARESEGCKAWAAKHGGRGTLPIDRSAPPTRANSDYDVLG